MNPDDFKNLALIPNMLKQIEEMSNIIKKMMPPITTKKEVAKFLEKSEGTINNYMSSGLLKEGKHFYRKNGGKMLVFVESAIIEFRKELLFGVGNAKVTF
jgi:predicted metal-dependent hydrolase